MTRATLGHSSLNKALATPARRQQLASPPPTDVRGQVERDVVLSRQDSVDPCTKIPCQPFLEQQLVGEPAIGRNRHVVGAGCIGPDRAGNLIEVIVLTLAGDRRLAVHAMPMRKKYRDVLPQEGNHGG